MIKQLMGTICRSFHMAPQGCTANVRQRKGWGTRMLTVAGPVGELDRATAMARELAAAHAKYFEEHGQSMRPGFHNEVGNPQRTRAGVARMHEVEATKASPDRPD